MRNIYIFFPFILSINHRRNQKLYMIFYFLMIGIQLQISYKKIPFLLNYNHKKIHNKIRSKESMFKFNNYPEYRALAKKQKQKLIQQAEQDQKDRGPNPQGSCHFHQMNWVEFKVPQNQKTIKLCTYRHQCIGQPKAVVIMLHGLNSYVGHGAHIAHHFAKHGIITVGFDHRGFGRSEGEPGYVDSLQMHIQDSLKFIQIVRKTYPNPPFFCLGLSMGGMTTYYLSLRYRYLFEGAIMMAPAIKNNISGFLVGVTNTLASILGKKTKLMKPIYGKASRNPKITEDVKNDQFAFSQRARLSTLQMLVSTMDKTPETFPLYKCPFMIIQGGLDKLVNPDGAFELYDNSTTKQEDKQLLFYQKMWHDIWHEPQIPQIIEKTTVWILKRLKKLQHKQNPVHLNSQIKNQHQIKKEVNNQKISFKPDEHELSQEVAVSASEQIRLEEKLQKMELQQLKHFGIQQSHENKKAMENKQIK